MFNMLFVRPARAGVRLFARGSKSCVRTVSSACKWLPASVVGHPVQHPDETERIGQFIGRAEISTSVGLLLLVFRADDVPQFDFVADLLFCDSPQASSGFGAILFHAEQIGGGDVGGVDFSFIYSINVL